EEGEDTLTAARREFSEETGFIVEPPFIELGSIQQKSGKIVFGWAAEGDVDASLAKSNFIKVIWPRGSGRWLKVPEVDRCEWFAPEVARQKINPAQADLIDRLLAVLRHS